jgi:hypothetical protein
MAKLGEKRQSPRDTGESLSKRLKRSPNAFFIHRDLYVACYQSGPQKTGDNGLLHIDLQHYTITFEHHDDVEECIRVDDPLSELPFFASDVQY